MFKTVSVLYKIFEQANADVFIMDWEEPKQGMQDKERKNNDEDDNQPIAWRSIFIANELNEIQTEERIIPPETTFVWFAFFWVGLGWEYIAQTNPELKNVDNPLEPYNMFLKFFWGAFIFISIAICQLVLKFVQKLFGNKVVEFSDLCCVANCSIIILTEKFHGFYIHGHAPWKRSDLPMAWLKEELDHEYEARR